MFMVRERLELSTSAYLLAYVSAPRSADWANGPLPENYRVFIFQISLKLRKLWKILKN